MRAIGPFRIVPRPDPPATVVVGVTLLAILGAFAVGALIFWGYGVHPLHAYSVVLSGTLGDWRGVAQVLRRATPLLLVGVGLVLAFRARFWNIGAEGQLLAGAVGAAGVALFAPIPAPWMLPAMAVAAAAAGVLWGMLPTVLRGRLGVNEVITTLMMNYIAIYVVEWLIHGPWKGKAVWGFPYSDTFPRSAWLPWLPGTQVHWPTLVIGLALAVAGEFLLRRTRLGHEVRVLGENVRAARYAGIDVMRTISVVMALSASAAALAGFGEVAGIHRRLLGPTQISLGYGYTGIIVALLARGSPLGAILASLFMGLIFASGDVMKVALRMPFQAVNVFNGLILFFVVGCEPLMRYQIRWAREVAPWPERTGSSAR